MNKSKLIYLLLLNFVFIVFANSQTIDTNNKNSNTEIYYTPKDFVDFMPYLNCDGGVNMYIYKRIKWPGMLDAEGKMAVSFVVTKNGIVESIIIEKRFSTAIEEQVISIMNSMPLWEPGIKDTKPIDVKLYLVLNFKLSGK